MKQAVLIILLILVSCTSKDSTFSVSTGINETNPITNEKLKLYGIGINKLDTFFNVNLAFNHIMESNEKVKSSIQYDSVKKNFIVNGIDSLSGTYSLISHGEKYTRFEGLFIKKDTIFSTVELHFTNE